MLGRGYGGGVTTDDVLSGKTIAVLGLSFKSGTSDVHKSPAIIIANTLAEQGAHVKTYDPEAMEDAKPHLDDSVALVDDLA